MTAAPGHDRSAFPLDVHIVAFPETRVAIVEHRGPPALEHDTVRKLVAWKLAHRLLDPCKHRSYGVHHTDPRSTPPSEHRVDFCLSIDDDQELGADDRNGIHIGVLPRLLRCACARDIGSRADNKAAAFLRDAWLPGSGERLDPDFPLMIFHYLNVGPGVRDEEMITDVYLPLR